MSNASVSADAGTADAPAGSATPTLGIFTPALLDRCISCGFCLPACPTYDLTKDEASSPRGRITLMRALETGALPDRDPTLAREASFCLGCRACEPVCPAGVEYGALLEQWRDHQWSGWRVPLIVRILVQLVRRDLLVRLMGFPGGNIGAGRPKSRGSTGPGAATPAGAGRVHLMLGCFERAMFPRVSRAARRLRPELWKQSAQGCCGALHAHNGESEQGVAMAHHLAEQLPGTIVTTSGGCAAHLTSVLGRDRVLELSEYLTREGTPPLAPIMIDGRRARVAIQDSCHLRNGMGVHRQPRALIAQVADYVDIASAGRCCGAAGTYSLLRPKDSKAVLDPKLDDIEAAGVDYLVVVNPGCQRQMIDGLRRRKSTVKVLHLAELLARAADAATMST
jgi:glycolate oxidase iron-sulfur subunit